MATSRLKVLNYLTTPGTTSFTIPALAFCRLVKVARENIPLLEIADTVHALPLNRTFTFHKPTGKITVSVLLPFDRERIFIMYKDPVV